MTDWSEFFGRRSLMPDDYYALDRADKLLSFSYSNAACLDQIKFIQTQLAGVYKSGGTFRDFKKLALDGEIPLTLPDYHMQNIFRTNVMSCNNRGSYLEQMNDQDYWPYYEYLAIRDKRVRPNHLALHKLVVKFGTPEGDMIYPPNGYQCRCTTRVISEEEAKSKKLSDEETAQIIRNNPPDKGFEGPPYQPGTPSREKIMEPIEKNRIKLISDADFKQLLLELENGSATGAQTLASVVPEANFSTAVAELNAGYNEAMKIFEAQDAAKPALPMPPAGAPKGLPAPPSGGGGGGIPPTKDVSGKKLKKRAEEAVKAGIINEATEVALDAKAMDHAELVFQKSYAGSAVDRTWLTMHDRVDEILKGIRECGKIDTESARIMRYLTSGERALLTAYTKDSELLNKILRGTKKSDQDTKAYLTLVSNIFDNLSQIETKPKKLFRGNWNPGGLVDTLKGKENLLDILKNFKPKDNLTIGFEAFSSSAAKQNVAEEFMRKGLWNSPSPNEIGIIYKLENTNKGLPITSISAKAAEVEYLFNFNEKFKIIKVGKKLKTDRISKRKYIEVTMEYSTEKGLPDYKFNKFLLPRANTF